MGGLFSVLIAGRGCTGVAFVGFSGIRLCRKNGTKSRPPCLSSQGESLETRKQRDWAPHVPSTPIDASARWIHLISAVLLMSEACVPLPGWLLTKQKPYFCFCTTTPDTGITSPP